MPMPRRGGASGGAAQRRIVLRRITCCAGQPAALPLRRGGASTAANVEWLRKAAFDLARASCAGNAGSGGYHRPMLEQRIQQHFFDSADLKYQPRRP